MRGVSVTIPDDPRVAVIDKGFVTQTMIALGVDDKIVATGGVINPTSKAPTKNRDTLYLRSNLVNLSNFGYYSYGGLNFETLLSAKPNLVIWHMQDDTQNDSQTLDFIKKINDAGIPVVVIKTSGVGGANSSIQTEYDGIQLLGKIFNKDQRADDIVKYINNTTTMVYERTKNIPDSKKPSVLIVGLGNDGSGYVWGSDYGSAQFSTSIAHLKNVYNGNDTVMMSKEQIIALNPDKIVVVDGPQGISSPAQIYNLSGFESWQAMPAIKNKQVVSVGIFPWWGDFCLEFPTITLLEAKSTYPDSFSDINVSQWQADYHKFLYGINDTQTIGLADQQHLKWMYDQGY
jgi:iron complex transport system substrate-binding protein